MKKLMVFALQFLLVAMAFGQTPDPTKIPHYFGPFPNWANSPLTAADANIQLTDTCGNGAGTGATAVAQVNAAGAITAILVTNQGSGYTCAPDVAITSTNGSGATAIAGFTGNGGFISALTLVNGGSNYFSPVVTINGSGTGATADATVDPYTGAITSIILTNPGSGYTAGATTVVISDDGGTGSGASATADVATGVITVAVSSGGIGYRTPGGIRKFVDGLPGLGPGAANNLGQYVSLAHPDMITYPGSDYYEIAVVEYSKRLHSDLLPTQIRGYVQLNNGTDTNGNNTIAPDAPQWLGATIIASKDRPVRILFKNQLTGNLFLPVDTTLMGSGPGPQNMTMATDSGTVYDNVRNPVCGAPGTKDPACFSENRAVLHLHGGTTPWISDGTPHQWTASASDSTNYPKGASVSYVPDMWFVNGAVVPQCGATVTSSCSVPNDPTGGPNLPSGASNNPGPGALTYYYTNQQSARLLFYHDHAWGITRLNVYAGEAAGYLITDNTEQQLIAPSGPLDATDPALGFGIPLVIQDRTFVPSAAQLAIQDPTWDASHWGSTGNFWYHHVYMTAQNPADPTGVSPYGRWMYGPWFWPPSTNTPYQPIANPYYVPNCDPATAPNGFCEPPQIPGTPNISVGMEQFNDTPMVNGTAYPTVTLEPKPYRFRILSVANDRFFNLQWYVADSSGTEVALKASEVAAAQNDPNVFPTPDTTLSPVGPTWLQIGTEGGFLPTPVTVPNQPITWITDPTRFDFGNVDQHSLLLAPAERADVVVDFSRYAGKTLILYNDAPAAFPARQASYDYYTGDPDNTDIGGAPSTIPGYGPNTRTVMQVKVASGVSTASKFSLSKLVSAFQHNATETGVFESSQHPIVVGQAGYNRAYGTNFTTSGDCSGTGTPTIPCDGYARINQQGGDPFTFDTLSGNKLHLFLQPKALHDEMNSTTFDEYGRMQATIGVEAVPATANAQNVVLYPFVNPATEIIDSTSLPSGASLKVTPIATMNDGTQIWKITHNGVDTHPIHFHLFDVQVINRVTWDNIILPPDFNELGWKDTVRISPLEDTLVALRPVVPLLPFEIPNSIRPLNPMMPLGSTLGFNSIDPNGNPTAAITNELVNFGWEYVWHCHILSHEEMDMMRSMTLAVPAKPPALTASIDTTTGDVNLNWTEPSRIDSFTGFTLYKAEDPSLTTNKTILGTYAPAAGGNFVDSGAANSGTPYFYGVAVDNKVGYGVHDAAYPSLNASALSNVVTSGPPSGGAVPPTVTFTGAPASAAYNSSFVVTATTNASTIPTITGTGVCSVGAVSGTAASASATVTMTSGTGVCTLTADWAADRFYTAATASQTTNAALAVPTVSFTGAPASTLFGASFTVTATTNASTTPAITGNAACSAGAVSGSSPATSLITMGGPNGTSWAACTVTADWPADTYYAAATLSQTVNPQGSLTITASSANMTYGGPAPAITPSYSGFVNGDTAAAVTAAPVCSTTATSTSATGTTYPSSCSGAVAPNYVITYVPGTVTIVQANTTTQITSNVPNQSIVGQVVSIGFKVNPQFTGVPTGNVTVSANGQSCTGALANGAGSCTIAFTLGGVKALTATYAGDLNFTSSTSTPVNQTVSSISLSTFSLLFGNQVVGTRSATQQVTIANVGTTTLTITGFSWSPNFSDSNNCGGSLGPGRSCRVNVVFAPTTTGVLNGTLTITDSDITSPQVVTLTGTGIQAGVSLSPASWSFGTVPRRTTSPSQTFVLANTGSAILNINSIGLAGGSPNQFIITSRTCGNTLAIGATCNINLAFAPNRTGNFSATLRVADNAPNSPQTVTLTGTGR